MTNENETNEFKFEVTGGFDIEKDMTVGRAADDEIVRFSRKGKTFRLVVALEIEDESGNMTYTIDEADMAKAGFHCLDYDKTDFYPTDPGAELKEED